VSVLALLVGLLLPAPAPESALALFDLRIEREGTEWRVSCAQGCAYSRATVECGAHCAVIVSSRGVQTRRDEQLAETSFAFVLTPIENGWQAESLHGTAWRVVSASCTRGDCRTRLNEGGVTLR
jgi:hypothetical protein